PEGPLITDGEWIFQQDNAPIHRSHSTRSWFEVNGVVVMAWPARSPDLNPIENLWGWLVRRVYANGRQYSTTDGLKQAILEEWDNVPATLLHRLVDSMHTRLASVVYNHGGQTKY